MRKHIPLLAVLLAVITAGCGKTDADVTAMNNMVSRLFPDRRSYFTFAKVPADSVDYFTVESSGDKITVSGNNANSMAMGLNYYLKNYCLTEVSWYRNDPVVLPDRLPPVEGTIRVDARVQNRFFLNYCTFGYTMPWWEWEDWERFIDWMALNGVNMPLAITGQESIWYNVWTRLGLTDQEVREYFTGPAHLPWHRMCNIDRWQGNLPMEWLENQAELQKRIVARERELNMRPVLPGFAGHVPGALKRIYPDLQTTTVSEWGGFSDDYRCTYLSPADSLFAVIQKEYLTEQTALYGTDHIYGIDPFNEVSPPTWNPDSLRLISEHIYQSLTAVDPDAVWLQMAWLFYADSKNWTPERVKPFLQGVPQGRMILLDYYCEFKELWKEYDRFYGQPYIWCYLGNFGGNSFLASPIKDVDARMTDVFAHGGDNLYGIGSTLEGFDLNPYMYEFVLDKAWEIPGDRDAAIENIADRRAGYRCDAIRNAWKLLADSIFVQPAICGQGSLTNARPSMEGYTWWTTQPDVDYANRTLVDAWGMMLAADSCNSDSYTFDVVNIGRQALSNYFMAVRDDFAAAYRRRDIAAMKELGARMTALLDDMTELLRGHSTFSMKKWIDDARAMSADSAVQDYYERNARTLVTIWGDRHNLNDYANRSWAELNDAYYAARWRRFIDMSVDAVASGLPIDEQAYYDSIRRFEKAWIEPATNPLEYFAPTDGVAVSRRLYDKYSDMIRSHAASHGPTSHEFIIRE